MGNNNCKQCTTSVFENEEDEETWFEWIESRKEASSNQNIISPKARPWPVQPLAFQADTINRQKKSRSKPALNLFTEGTALKGLHLANSEDDRPSLQSVADNNNSPRKNRLRGEEESIYSQVREQLGDRKGKIWQAMTVFITRSIYNFHVYQKIWD